MEDNMKRGSANTQYDKGTANHLRMKHNSCGCVMEMDVDADMKATKARMLTCGLPNPDASSPDSCVITRIASPDNVAMIPDYNQLIIGEDTGSHQNDLIWIYDLASGAMTRIGSTPYGSETTSPYWYTIGDWQYMTFVVQHPYGESDQNMLAEAAATGEEAHIGYVGPFPTKPGQHWQRPFATWTDMPYPVGIDKEHPQTSPMVQLQNELGQFEIGYHHWYRTGDEIGMILFGNA